MDIFFSVFQAVATMFGIGIIGFVIIHKRLLDVSLFSLMTPLVVDIALPSMVFYNIVTKLNPEKFFKLWIFPGYWIAETIFFLILTFIFSKIARNEFKNEFAISLFYQNGIFLPIIVISQIYGSQSQHLVNLFLFTVFYPAFFFNTYYLFFKKNKQNSFEIKNILNFVLIATIISVFIKITGINNYLPLFIFKIFKLVGGMTIPLLMIIIGGNIYLDFKKKEKFEFLENFKFILIKNFVFPLITIGILYVLKIKSDIALLLFLESAVPPITAIPIFVSRCGGNSTIVNQFLISSFIISLISIPLMYTVFNYFIF